MKKNNKKNIFECIEMYDLTHQNFLCETNYWESYDKKIWTAMKYTVKKHIKELKSSIDDIKDIVDKSKTIFYLKEYLEERIANLEKIEKNLDKRLLNNETKEKLEPKSVDQMFNDVKNLKTNLKDLWS